jgi:hypothetical protein
VNDPPFRVKGFTVTIPVQNSGMMVTAADSRYRLRLCNHPKKERELIKLVTGDIIGYLCRRCDHEYRLPLWR